MSSGLSIFFYLIILASLGVLVRWEYTRGRKGPRLDSARRYFEDRESPRREVGEPAAPPF